MASPKVSVSQNLHTFCKDFNWIRCSGRNNSLLPCPDKLLHRL